MKNIYKYLKVLLVMLPGLNFSADAQTTTFSYTGATQTYTVPTGMTTVLVYAEGGMGGNNAGVSMSDRPGYGGCVTATLAVTPGDVLNIYVGQKGGNSTTLVGGTGGYNGGGNGALGYTPYAGGGGGGASDIRMGGIALANRVIVAAGGGGAGGNWFLPAVDYDRGGDGGGLTGEAGWDGNVLGDPGAGGGGTPTVGGVFGIYAGWGSGTAGVLGVGGNAGSPSGGGGGGGGYYGGGGASWGGGGGGSNYTDPTLATVVTHTRGCNTGTGPGTGNGMVTITVTCVPPVAGAIVGPATFCQGANATYTNPTGTAGGVWSTSDALVATIDPVTGIATGTGPGVVTFTYDIILSCGSATTSVTVTVDPAPAAISGPDSVCLGGAISLTDPTPGGTWSSSAIAVADIGSATGFVSTFSAGTATISYTAAGCSSFLVVTVNPLPAPIVGPSQVCRFLTMTLTDATPGGTWSSVAMTAATVDPAGMVTGIGGGGASTNIVYTLPTGCFVTHYVVVTIPPLPITGPNQVCEGSAMILNELIPGGVWASSAPAVATVGSTSVPTAEVVTGLLPGTVTISYTVPACPAVTHVVTVNPLPAIITGPTAICTGLTTTLANATPGGTWSSSDPSISVSPAGVVTGTTSGISGTISYTLPTTCFVTVMVNVSTPPTPILGADNMCQGLDTILSNVTPGGIWSSTDLAVAPVIYNTGLVSGVSAGTVTISYTLSTGCYATKTFTVDPPLTGSVTIGYSPMGIICAGTEVTLTATPTNGGTPTFQWKKFSVDMPGETSDTLRYRPIHGDVFNIFMRPVGVCALYDSVADSIVINVYPDSVIPVVSIMTTSSGTISAIGETATFFSNVTWGGTSPSYQWYRNGAPVPGANGSSFAATIYANDTFWCEVTGNPPCPGSSPSVGVSNKIIIYNLLGVDPLSQGANSITLFPNPNNGSFTLSGSVTGHEVGYEVSNMLGQVMHSGRTIPQNGKISEQIKVEGLAAGTYLLRVRTDAGSETFHFVIAE